MMPRTTAELRRAARSVLRFSPARMMTGRGIQQLDRPEFGTAAQLSIQLSDPSRATVFVWGRLFLGSTIRKNRRRLAFSALVGVNHFPKVPKPRLGSALAKCPARRFLALAARQRMLVDKFRFGRAAPAVGYLGGRKRPGPWYDLILADLVRSKKAA